MRMSRTARIVYGLCALIFAFLFIFPLFWVLLTALKVENEVMRYPLQFWPKVWNFSNFVAAWQSQDFTRYTWNTILVALGNGFGQLISASMAAFAFARYEFKGKRILFAFLLGTMMLPWDVTVIPQYMEFNFLGWIDTLKPLTVPALFGSAYYIYYMRQYLESTPGDFHDAGRIDGASEWLIYARIYLPIMRPALVLVLVQTLITVWNDYLGPLVFLNSRSNYTLALGLASFRGLHSNAIVPTMCVSVMMASVPIVVFFFAQKQILEGISGSVKG
ncbi:MAG: carbohydrate ABC transporter permease [Eubacteriales bacterium]|nr:carbohydrate ABC transporter permease [Eubacteriales bacterium]